MPLYLCRSSIHHRTGEDSQYSGGRLQNTFLHDCLVLLDPCMKRYIVLLGP